MNIYEKLQQMRVELQQKNIKKSGKNKFAGYEYYELSDILPPINELQSKYKTCSFISFDKEKAALTIVNSEKPEEKIEFTSPMAELTLKGGQEIQNLGGVETYQRRYLYMTTFEIVENDYFDCVQGKEQKQVIKKSQSNLADTKMQLKKSMAEYSKLSNKKMPEIVEELKGVIKKDLQSISETEVKTLLTYLQGKIAKINSMK